MIFILCKDYESAEKLYFEFIQFLLYNNEVIVNWDDYGLCVETDEDLMYIFIDERWLPIIEEDIDEPFDVDFEQTFREFLYEPPWERSGTFTEKHDESLLKKEDK